MTLTTYLTCGCAQLTTYRPPAPPDYPKSNYSGEARGARFSGAANTRITVYSLDGYRSECIAPCGFELRQGTYSVRIDVPPADALSTDLSSIVPTVCYGVLQVGSKSSSAESRDFNIEINRDVVDAVRAGQAETFGSRRDGSSGAFSYHFRLTANPAVLVRKDLLPTASPTYRAAFDKYLKASESGKRGGRWTKVGTTMAVIGGLLAAAGGITLASSSQDGIDDNEELRRVLLGVMGMALGVSTAGIGTASIGLGTKQVLDANDTIEDLRINHFKGNTTRTRVPMW